MQPFNVNIIEAYTNEIIKENFSISTLPLSNWDQIYFDGYVYGFENLVHHPDGKIEIYVNGKIH
ncbi:MAG: hypothetical protein M3Z26_07615 [Bacteroidota bacterium]|nr:hypothetical protein [Bacteroidota bacterium]